MTLHDVPRCKEAAYMAYKNTMLIHPSNSHVEVQQRIDQAMDSLLFQPENGTKTIHPSTCFSCHSFIKRKEKRTFKKSTLKKIATVLKPRKILHANIIQFYKYTGEGHETWMDDLLLSPCSCFDSETDSFLVCRRCHVSLKVGNLPIYAIANSFEFGEAPPELKCLSDIELAFLSPVRAHGHLFTFFGGIQGIKGWHSFLEIDIANVYCNMRAIDQLPPVPNNIAVVLTGPYTDAQKQRVIRKATLRRDKVATAMDWLRNNNTQWFHLFQDINLDLLPSPIVVDKR
jgi:hypothetical protein